MTSDLTVTNIFYYFQMYIADDVDIDDMANRLKSNAPCPEDIVVQKDLFEKASPEAREIIGLLVDADPDIVGDIIGTYKEYNKRKLCAWIRKKYPGKGVRIINELTRLARAC